MQGMEVRGARKMCVFHMVDLLAVHVLAITPKVSPEHDAEGLITPKVSPEHDAKCIHAVIRDSTWTGSVYVTLLIVDNDVKPTCALPMVSRPTACVFVATASAETDAKSTHASTEASLTATTPPMDAPATHR